MPDLNSNSENVCPECHIGNLIEKTGRFGNFTGCSNFPNCRYIVKKTPQTGLVAAVETNETCEKCGIGKFVIREGQFGKFKACSNFPKCKNTKKVT